VARQLADVLHYFLDDGAAAAPAAPARCLALVAEPDEVLGVAFLWNLAHELSRRGTSVAWVNALSDEELLPGDATPGLARVLAPVDELAGLASAVREAGAKLLRAQRAPELVLTRVPPAWLAPEPGAHELLSWTLLLAGPDPERRDEARLRSRRIADAFPGARIGVTVHGVRSVREAETAYGTLARELATPGTELWSYGLLLEDHLLYDALLARRPLTQQRPDSRAAHSLRDVARLLHEDWRRDAA
jgi:hypothetical protein